jgi:predicted ATP-grasp superfamily ATP-dependent carboligase
MRSANNGDRAGKAPANPIALIGFAEALSAPEVSWSLLDDGFRVVAFCRKGRRSALLHSRYTSVHEVCAPEVNLEQCAADLENLISSLDGDAGTAREKVLLPLDDSAVWLCSRTTLGEGWHLAGPRDTQADLALNKLRQVTEARLAGLAVAQTRVIETVDDVRALEMEGWLPFVLRPLDCISVREGRVRHPKMWICANGSELERAMNEWAGRVPLLAQRYIPGTGEGVFGLATSTGIVGWSAHRRLRMMNPQGSGSSACMSVPVSPELKRTIGRLIENTGWRGLFMIELLRDSSGVPWFIELNGRPWGSIALSRRQGLEYPAWQARMVLRGEQPEHDGEKVAIRPGLICKHVGRELMHLAFVLRGPRSQALRSWPRFWPTLRGVLSSRRGDALYNWRADDPSVFFADVFYTMRDNLHRPSRR